MHRGITIIIIASLSGRNLFQVRYIRLSYRMRGIVARIHTKIVAIIIVFITSVIELIGSIPENRIVVNSLMNRMLAYSAIKINANIPPLYSTLNPETNSDSPSEKSNGDRLVSAKLVINQNNIIIGIKIIGHVIYL